MIQNVWRVWIIVPRDRSQDGTEQRRGFNLGIRFMSHTAHAGLTTTAGNAS